jgi:proton-dependent oligopeptide transporter, POT family
MTAAQFGSLNPFFIITLAPLFAWLWVWLARRRLEPSTPVKFSLGIMQAGLGFGALVLGASFPDEAGKVSVLWLVLAYLLHTTGELSLSPVGLSAVTKLSVPRVVGLMMGAWFLATAYSEYLAARIAKLASIETPAGGEIEVARALAGYTELFQSLFMVGVGAGLLLLLLSPLLRKSMHGIH